MEGFAPKTIKGAGIIGLSLLLFPILCLGEIQTRGTLNTFSDLPKFLPDEIIVKFKPDIPAERIDAINSFYGTKVIYRSPYAGFFRLRIPEGKTVGEMVEVYSRQPEVEYAEPNYTATALFCPNDPYYRYQWNLKAEHGINAEKAWDISKGDGVIVAVLDTGVAYEDFGIYRMAPDLRGVRFVRGYDFVENDPHPNDDNGHGTHVAGTIAQATNNGMGVAGIAFNCSIMPVKVLDRNGHGNYAWIADGIYYAVKHGARVINMSLGGSEPAKTLEDALRFAYRSGVILVAAAGNEFLEDDSPAYPAAYDEYCIAVGAVTCDGKRAYYSNTGWYIDLVAPGGNVWVDRNGDGYGDGILQQTFVGDPRDFKYWFFQGTSMAAPHVSAVCALLISKGVEEPPRIREALFRSARDLGEKGWDEEYGWGLLDAFGALNYALNPGTERSRNLLLCSINAPSEVISGEKAELRVKVQNMSPEPERVTVSVSDLTDKVQIDTAEVEIEPFGVKNLCFNWDTSEASEGLHRIAAEVRIDDDDPSDNVKEVWVNVVSKESRLLLVKDVKIHRRRLFHWEEVYAVVTVVDGKGNPVKGALVEGMWKAGFMRVVSMAWTDIYGKAVLISPPLFGDSDSLSFELIRVSKPGWIFKPHRKGKGVNVVRGESEMGFKNAFYRCYPNPANSEVWIPFEIGRGSEVRITVYDLMGKPIRRMNLGYKAPGRYLERWDGRDERGEEVSSGIYFIKLEAGGFKGVEKVAILK